ncbi:MAG: PD40 domain-containing protein [Anaerolineae bacterium]|nr:PD40 domain-containing protein [Anaerolineae bacterium]
MLVVGVVLVAWLARRDTDSAERGDHPPIAYFFQPANVYPAILYLSDNRTTRTLVELSDHLVDYAVSPDGSQIAFSRSNADGTIDIWLVEVATGNLRPLTDCVKARCEAPTWRADGSQIAYQRHDRNPVTDRLEPRVWIVDVQTAQSRLLAEDVQQHGATPVWDPTGRRIAYYDETVPGIRVLDMASGSEVVIANRNDVVGAFSPDGSRLVYPVLTRGALRETFYSQLEIVDFESMAIEYISSELVEDVFAAWSPDGTQLLVARRYLDERYTAGTQLYTLEIASGAVEPVIVDPAYHHAAMSYDATGRWIVFQRFALTESGAEPEIWLHDTETGETRLIAPNAFFPAFVNPSPR